MTEMTDTAAQQVAPWYQHGWVWAVFSIPFAAVLFGVVMIVSAGYRPDDLVVLVAFVIQFAGRRLAQIVLALGTAYRSRVNAVSEPFRSPGSANSPPAVPYFTQSPWGTIVQALP